MSEKRMDTNLQYDICIVGAGVAGAAMAGFLGKNGKKVVIVERNLNERDVIVGELLQPGGVKLLREMGLEFYLDNIDAQPVFGYNILFEGREIQIEYPHEDGKLTGFGFRNGKFVQNMRKYIQSLENVKVIEGRVLSLLEENGKISGVKYNQVGVKDEKVIKAALTIVSDGPLSHLRDSLSEPEIKINGFFVGIILENCSLPIPNYGHLVMSDQPPFVMYPVNSEEVRILIDYPGTQPPKLNDDFRALLLERYLQLMPEAMKKSFMQSVEKGGFKMMPNHRLPAVPIFKTGAVLLGDSLNMRHPLTGGGMSCAFADIFNLGNKLIEINDFYKKDEIDRAVKLFYETRHLGNQTINILADGLYGVVNHPDLREAFFEYLMRGGKHANEPIAILGGLNKDKKLLRRHFFAVAKYGTKLKIKHEAGKRKLESSYTLMKEAVKIITPLLMSEKPDPATKILLEMLSKT